MRRVNLKFVCFIALVSSCLWFACDEEEETPGPSDMGATDSSDQTAELDQTSDLDDTDGSVEPADPLWEVVYLVHWLHCPGCQEVPTPFGSSSEATLSEMAAYPNQTTGLMFGRERAVAAIRALPIDTCALLDTTALLTVPDGDCMDAGDLDFTADWTQWGGDEGKVTLNFNEMLDNYQAVFVMDWGHGYEPGKTLGLHAHGGADIAEFSASAISQEQIGLVSPHVDEAGQIPDVPHDQPLIVQWDSHSDTQTIVLWLNGIYAFSSVRMDYLGCHLLNDGEFTIPAEPLGQFEWANFTTITLADLSKVELAIEEIEHPVGWTVGTAVELYIGYDPDAQIPPPTERPGIEMEEGYVGQACDEASECGGGQCLDGLGFFMDGYCSVAECIHDEDCPADALCHVNVHPSCPYYSFCAKRCTESSDCREPYYMCAEREEGQICVPAIF